MADKDKVQELSRKFDEVIELARKLDEVQELALKLDEMIELARKLSGVQELAQKLHGWSEKLPDEQKKLLQWLLSRGAYVEKRVDKQHVEGTAMYVFKMDIEQAVKDALGPLTKANLPDPRDGWPRSFGTWPRMDGWPRNGYWGWPRSGYLALGMGCPPKLDKMPPEIPMPPKGPKTH
jgi:hypothetical protein